MNHLNPMQVVFEFENLTQIGPTELIVPSKFSWIQIENMDVTRSIFVQYLSNFPILCICPHVNTKINIFYIIYSNGESDQYNEKRT